MNRYLDREYVAGWPKGVLRLYAYDLLHFVRWWASVHETGDVSEQELTESTLLEYLRFQSGLLTAAFRFDHQRTHCRGRPRATKRVSRRPLPDRPRISIKPILHRRPMG